jgi:hypothetical protein
VTAWGRDFTHYWLRVDAPIHSDETYLVGFYVDGSTTVPDIRCQFAQTDLSDDQMYESYIHFDGSYTTLKCDLDISVIHQYGMGHTVSGWDLELQNASGGGGGDSYYPSSRDGMTESLTPTGTEEGGKWDGDWATQGTGLALDAVEKTKGSYSIKATLTYNLDMSYLLDTPVIFVYGYGPQEPWLEFFSTMLVVVIIKMLLSVHLLGLR